MKTNRCKFNKVFLGLILFLFLINLPFFLNLTFLNHDTLFCFLSFYTTYNDFFHHREFIQWLPYSAYGVPTDLIQLHLTVVDYFFILIGGLLRIEDALLLYKASLLIEQSIFLLGMFLLSMELFKKKTTIFFVCASSLGGLVLRDQIIWDFLAFYLLPLIIYYFRMFFKKHDLRYLALAMTIGILSLVGSVPYYVAIIIPVLFIIFIFLSTKHYREWKKFFDIRKKNIYITIGLFVIFLVLILAFSCISFYQRDQIRVLSTGRDPATYKIPLNVFLTYGGHIGFDKFIDFILPLLITVRWSEPTLYVGWSDLTLYIGFLALLFVIYGIIKGRDTMLYAFLSIVVILTFLSLGGVVSRVLYYIFPGMKYYRHIGLSVGCFKVFLPLIAGFGLDSFLKNSDVKVFSVGRFIVADVLLVGAWLYYNATNNLVGKKIAFFYIFLLVTVILILTLQFRNFSGRQYFELFLIIGICLELIGYQAIVASKSYETAKYRPKDFRRVSNYKFQLSRTINPPDKRSRDLFNYLVFLRRYGSEVYTPYYNFLQWDPCATIFRTDVINRYVALLLESKGARVGLFEFALPKDINLLRSVGCYYPKLRLISNVIFAADEKEAVNIIKKTKTIDEIVVLNNVPSDIRLRWKNYSDVKGTINVTNFSSNKLDLNVIIFEKSGAWLYYADGFHPAWKAFVNDKLTQIFQANTGFKAIKLDGGKSKVRFIYDNKLKKFAFYILIMAGVAFTIICLFKMWKIMFHLDQ